MNRSEKIKMIRSEAKKNGLVLKTSTTTRINGQSAFYFAVRDTGCALTSFCSFNSAFDLAWNGNLSSLLS